MPQTWNFGTSSDHMTINYQEVTESHLTINISLVQNSKAFLQGECKDGMLPQQQLRCSSCGLLTSNISLT